MPGAQNVDALERGAAQVVVVLRKHFMRVFVRSGSCRVVFLGAFGACIAVSSASQSAAQSSQVTKCPASFVHFERDPEVDPRFKALPWIAPKPTSSGIRGRLFYYTPLGPAPPPWVKQRSRALKIYTRGMSPDGLRNMKVLWTARDGDLAGARMVIRGRSTGGDRYTQVVSVGPSMLSIPRAGCWTLTMTVMKVKASFRIEAVDGGCDSLEFEALGCSRAAAARRRPASGGARAAFRPHPAADASELTSPSRAATRRQRRSRTPRGVSSGVGSATAPPRSTQGVLLGPLSDASLGSPTRRSRRWAYRDGASRGRVALGL
jgi:hypothetical protein